MGAGCENPSRPGKTLCAGCAKDQSKRSYAWQKKRAAEGLCITCPAPRDGESLRCAACRAKNRECKKRPNKNARATLHRRQGGKCWACKVALPVRLLTLDHIIPRSQGGGEEIENLLLLCGTCNSTKGTRSLDYLLERLREDGIINEKGRNIEPPV